MTKNNLLADLKYKVFRSGNPVFFYIGINTIVFVAVALFGVTYFLAGNTNIRFLDYAKEYFAFPAALPKLPFRFYTVLTYQFLHEDIFHILFNMLWLFWMGNIFIDFLKPRQFHFVYLAGGVMGAVFFALAYNIFPPFSATIYAAKIIGSSASVMAIAVAVTTLLPDYTIGLMFIGTVKLRYVVLVYLLIDLIGIGYANPGGSFAHLGGAFMGFLYIKLLQNGNDWSNIFKKKPKLKVVKNEKPGTGAKNNINNKVNQKEVDLILDKISKSGYDKLSKEEKETLFKASKS
ncbi:rhomboid family intramembrane serine protease [Pedobacter hartonius]|uniref:Membrane associated serine protease, rhomboid family n=1 Tax=Pedobacter hartonius TaxID=425514 RepID=A0A1H3Z0P7_9SPHI|nr:rhomboid family intramembrane serine protease [Pedobacter hartonius]SEA16892.1 Membrane associated serine protease, rhomboid family [Pedobacter hartonius]